MSVNRQEGVETFYQELLSRRKRPWPLALALILAFLYIYLFPILIAAVARDHMDELALPLAGHFLIALSATAYACWKVLTVARLKRSQLKPLDAEDRALFDEHWNRVCSAADCEVAVDPLVLLSMQRLPSVERKRGGAWTLILPVGFLTLLSRDPETAKGLLAHELGHIRHEDAGIWRASDVLSRSFLVPLLLVLGLRLLVGVYNLAVSGDPAHGWLDAFFQHVVQPNVVPLGFAMGLLRPALELRGFSEALADAFAVRIGFGVGLLRAVEEHMRNTKIDDDPLLHEDGLAVLGDNQLETRGARLRVLTSENHLSRRWRLNYLQWLLRGAPK